MSEPVLVVNWAKLYNELFETIYRDPALLARYAAADSAQAQDICAEQLDVLIQDVHDFSERFLTTG